MISRLLLIATLMFGPALVLAADLSRLHVTDTEVIAIVVDDHVQAFIFASSDGKMTIVSLNGCAESDYCTALIRKLQNEDNARALKLHSDSGV